MATIAQIEANLLTASRTGNVTLFNTTVASITAAQKPLVTVYDETLFNLTNVTNAANASAMTRTLMQTVGTYVRPISIEVALADFAAARNYAAMDAVSDYLTATQKSGISPDHALQNLVQNDNWSSTTEDAAIANAVRDLMSKVGATAAPIAIEIALSEFAGAKNYAAMDAVSDYLTTAQKAGISPNRALQNLVQNDNWASTADNAAIASAVRDLMSKVGATAAPIYIEIALTDFAAARNYAAMDAVSDYLTSAQKAGISPDAALKNLVQNDNWASTAEDAAIASAVRDLMSKVGATGSPMIIEIALSEFAGAKNYGAMDAVSDYLTTAQKAGISPDRALQNLVQNDNWASTTEDTAIANAVRDLMSKVGATASPMYIEIALTDFAAAKNYAAMDAVSDYLTSAQKAGILPDAALLNLVQNDNWASATDDVTIANAVRDLMSKVGATASPMAIEIALSEFAGAKNYGAMDAVSDYLTTAQKAGISPDRALQNLVQNDNWTSATEDAAIANAVRDLMSKVGATASPMYIEIALTDFAAAKNYAALDAVSDYLTTAQKAGIFSDSALLNLVQNDNWASTADNTVIANTVRDLMVKVGATASPMAVEIALRDFAGAKNYDAVDAVIDAATTTQLNGALTAQTKTILAQYGAQLGTANTETINGTAAANNIFGLGGNDTVNGGAGNDRLYGESGSDWLYGDAGNDVLHGGIGNDVLVGGTENDLLAGGRGADDLTGGAGADTFFFDRNDVGSKDRIADFDRTAGDKIDISDVLELHNPNDVLSQFVKITYASGVATLSVDVNGAAGGANFVALTDIVGLTNGTTAEQLVTGGNLIV